MVNYPLFYLVAHCAVSSALAIDKINYLEMPKFFNVALIYY